MRKNIYPVGQVNKYIKNMFAQDFMLHLISIKGEVSNCKYHTSGHIYFTLKDKAGAMSAVMFAGNAKNMTFRMKDGDQVVVTGSVEVYEKMGTYQIYARQIELDGEGNLYLRFEQLKKELEEMGMFSSEYKQPVPKYINTLGVVTAPTGAAVRDIINIAKRRNPYIQIILYPAIVQGSQAAESIVNGIRALEQLGVDTIIVGRGGGSIEDLWAFNERIVAQAVFDCQIPIISAVGHETDTTITDYVADLRAPTPSAAAELAVYDYKQLMERLEIYQNALNVKMQNKINTSRNLLETFKMHIRYLNPVSKLKDKRVYCLELEEKLERLMNLKITESKHTLALFAEQLKGLSPLDKLSQGYAFAENSRGEVVNDVMRVKKGDQLNIYVKNGTINAEVLDVQEGLNVEGNNVRADI